MPSEGRLHPLSIVFSLTKQVSGLVIPLLLFLVGAGSGGVGWELLGLLFLIPSAAVSAGRYFTYRYRYEPEEMVIRSGFLFRSERHVPYARIQNVEAVQNVFHRACGVVEVRVQTGSGNEPEATMTVLPVAALDEMRRRVAAGRHGGPGREDSGLVPDEASANAAPVLLALPTREILLSGFIENRGMIVVGAALGLLWELNLGPRFVNALAGQDVSSRSAVRALFGWIFGGRHTPMALLLLAGAVAAFLLLTRILSMGWALIRLHGFTVTREADDLRVGFGLFTRLTTTIPLKRIQQVTIRETPLQRLFGRSSVRVATAGGEGGQDGASSQREWLAPIIGNSQLPRLLREVLPGVAADTLEWHPVHPRAFRRALKASLAMAGLACLAAMPVLRWSTAWIVPPALAVGVLHARLAVAGLGWATTGNAVAFRHGAFWRYVSIARFSKIQAVSLHESPFDRRTGMATLAVDTAGTSVAERVAVPFLDRAVADRLRGELAASAGRSTFRW